MKKICILGITGSIGSQAVDVINSLDGYIVESASCNTSFEKLDKYISDLNLKAVWVKEKSYLEAKYPNVKFYYDVDSFIKNSEADAVINALVGVAGLAASIATIRAKKELLLANKESLVLAGDIINKLLKENNVRMLPIDSEHSAIFQCLDGKDKNQVSELIITASGGALRDLDRSALKGVKINDVLNHPTWKMGGKITVDCATMVNKGFEVIEAHHLFGFDYDHIKTVLHQESAVHGAIKFKDGSVICQMGVTSMMLPIQYALTYPERVACNLSKNFDLTDTFNLHFRKMDYNRYPMLELAYKVARMGGIMPAVYCAANDLAVNKFLKGEIEFLEIENIINSYVNLYLDKNIQSPSIEDIYKVIDEISK
ncbi:MAG: 1-deoxy-D-xylulose-5-phosphate reductoisomerase [Bacilli bacterium]|nr:1-deoxy-D-xylulose-5-phosphate reductoisomerase [Bacilli bacterium]